MKPIVIIPARLASTRLPNKPLADIYGQPMIVHVWQRAREANIGPVLVACAETAIADAVQAAGGTAILTDPNHPSGSDRIWEALKQFDPSNQYDIVVNLQGDLPAIDPKIISSVLGPLQHPQVDIATLATEIVDEHERHDPNVVKAVIALANGATSGQALYFSRATIPSGPGPHYHHIGIYAYRRAALQRFIELPPGQLEIRERLEQLRALEHGMRIDAALVDTLPLGVDTPADLDRIRQVLFTHGTK